MDKSSLAALETDRPKAAAQAREKPPAPSPWRWLWLALLVVAGVALYRYGPPLYKRWQAAQPVTAPAVRDGRGGGVPPVVAARAVKGNIGVYLTGLGVVTPIYTVTVKSRVDGQLMQVLYREGDMVKQNDLLLEIDPRPYQVQLLQAEGQLARDQAVLENARVDLARYQTLWKQNAIPQQQLATQEALVSQYEGAIKADQAQIEAAKLNLVYCHIAAPISGRVGLRLVDPGNIVHANDSNGLLVITQIDPISVIFTIAEDQLPPIFTRLRAGQKLVVEAWDRDLKNRIARGTLATTDNQIDQTTGTLKLRANFDNKDSRLFPNQFVNARLLIEERGGVTLVPNAAIQRNSTASFAYLVKEDQTVTVRPITVGVSEGDQTQVISGIEPGDILVTEGVDKLQEGAKVIARIPGEGGGPGRHGPPGALAARSPQ